MKSLEDEIRTGSAVAQFEHPLLIGTEYPTFHKQFSNRGYGGAAPYWLFSIIGENFRKLKLYMKENIRVTLFRSHVADLEPLDTDDNLAQMIQKLIAPPSSSSSATINRMGAHSDQSAILKFIIITCHGNSGFRFIYKNEIVYFVYPACTFSANHGVNSSILSDVKHQSFNFCTTGRQIIVLDVVPIAGEQILYNADTVRELVRWFKSNLS